MKTEPIKITFQGGPLDGNRQPNYLQIFASNGSDEAKPDQYVRTISGTYAAEMRDEKQIIYTWKGASK
jgi:hypothetical protein